MSLITTLVVLLVALEHFFIFYLETLATQSAKTSKVFGMTQDELARPSVSTLFKNLGVYNGLVAAGLVYGLVTGNSDTTGTFLVFVLVAAGYGAVSSSPSILLKQGLPACLALLSLLFL